MTTSTNLTPTLAAVSVQAAQHRKLCQRYGLAPDATADEVETAILRRGEHVGFGHAMLAVQEAVSGVVKVEKAMYRAGNGCATLGD
jgi:hypothetical protein